MAISDDAAERDAIMGEVGDTGYLDVLTRRLLSTPREQIRAAALSNGGGASWEAIADEAAKNGRFDIVAHIAQALTSPTLPKEQALSLAIERRDWARAAKIAGELAPGATVASTWSWTYGAEMDLPLPPIPWVCEELELAPGAPTILAGYGGSGKTAASQALLLAAALGRPAWGRFGVRRGRVRHVDYEQGKWVTRMRYKRIGRAMAVESWAEIGEDFGTVSLPSDKLDHANIEETLVRELEGVMLAVIDSLRQGAPEKDENSSEMAAILSMLGRVSDRTGCCILVIHHARKTNDNDGDVRQILRGSSAIFDACQSVWVLVKKNDDEAGVLTNAKARLTGRNFDKFALTIGDIASDDDTDARWGMRVSCDLNEHLQEEQAAKTKSDLNARVLDYIRQNPNASGKRIYHEVRGGRNAIMVALEKLEESGTISNLGKGSRQKWVLRS